MVSPDWFRLVKGEEIADCRLRIGGGSDGSGVAADRDLRGACPDVRRGSEIADWRIVGDGVKRIL